MNEAVMRMLARYERRRVEDDVKALREILQGITLLGLWRSRFFERAAFYGGTALRILYGMDCYSEDHGFTGNTQIEGSPDNFGTRNSA